MEEEKVDREDEDFNAFKDTLVVSIKLTVEVDGIEIVSDEYPNTSAVEEDLYKIENAISMTINNSYKEYKEQLDEKTNAAI